MTILRFFLAIILLSLPFQLFAQETTTSRGRGGWGFSPLQTKKNQTDKLRERILCAFEKNKLPKDTKSNQRKRADYLSRHLSEIFSRLEPDWTTLELQHSLAQAVAETGNLRDVVELPSKHKSSRSKYKGRGLIQTTHKTNYAQLAGCAQTMKNNPLPQSISREALARSPRLMNSNLVRNPDQAMSERTQEGQFLNAASLVCYMVNTSERHKRLKKAMSCANPPCVREVGVAVNRGPGALGKGRKPLGDAHRIRAFCRMNSCFGNQGRCATGGR